MDVVIGADGANSRVAKDIEAGDYEYAIAFQEIPVISCQLGGGLKYFLFSSLFGEMIQFDEHIFQMG